MVHTGLAANAAVNHSKECCRYLYEGHSTHECGCCKTGDIADHTAAERDESRFAVEAVDKERCIDRVDPVECFEFFAVGDLDGHDEEACSLETFHHALPIKLLD